MFLNSRGIPVRGKFIGASDLTARFEMYLTDLSENESFDKLKTSDI